MKNSPVSFGFESYISFISSYFKKWYNFLTNNCIHKFLHDKPIIIIGHIILWIIGILLCICLIPCVIMMTIVAALIEFFNALEEVLPPKDEEEALFSMKPRCESCDNLGTCACKTCSHLDKCRNKCPEPGCTDEFERPLRGDVEDNKRLVDKKPGCAFCENLPYCKCNVCRHLEDCDFDCPTKDCQEKRMEILMEEEEFLSDYDEAPEENVEENDDATSYDDDCAPCD